MSSLRDKTIRGVKWTAISTVFISITSFVLQIIKARFLVPEEFASLAIISIIIGFMHTLEGAGFNKGVIQKDHVYIEEASSLLILNLVVSALMAVLVFFASPLIAAFFNLPVLHLYIKLISINLLCHGTAQFFRVFLQKNFLFREIALVEIFRQLIILIITTSLLVMGWGVLGCVFGLVSAAVLSTISFVVLGLRHKVTELRIYFSFSKIRFLIRFGAFVSGRQVINYFAKRIDEIAIGYFLDPDVLGIYFFGKSMLERLRQLLSKSYSKVLFPLFSKLKNDSQRLSDVYLKLTKYMATVAFPVFIGIALTAHLFVPVVFGEQWTASVIVFQVFSVALIFKMLTTGLAGNILYAVNRPDTLLYIDIITDFIYFAGLLVFAGLGMQAILILYSSYIVIKAVVTQYLVHQNLFYNLRDYLVQLKEVTAISLIMILVVVGFQYLASRLVTDIFLLIGSVTFGIISYSLLIWVFDKKIINEIRGMLAK